MTKCWLVDLEADEDSLDGLKVAALELCLMKELVDLVPNEDSFDGFKVPID